MLLAWAGSCWWVVVLFCGIIVGHEVFVGNVVFKPKNHSLISLMVLILRVSHQTKKQMVMSRICTSISLILIWFCLPSSLHKLIQVS